MMTDNARTNTADDAQPVFASSDSKHLAGLFDEMQALLAVMPGMGFDTGTRVSTPEEIEEMFDNMPV
jgi:hypothetical protein